MTNLPTEREQRAADLTQLARERPRGVVGESWGLLRHNKKWWLAPIIIVALIVGSLLVLLSTPVAPLIYTLF